MALNTGFTPSLLTPLSMATIGTPDALEIEGPTASKPRKNLHTVAPKFARQSRLIVHPNSAPRHILTRAVNHVVTVAPHVDLAQIHDDTATYLRQHEFPARSRLVLNLHSQNLPDPESDEWQEFKKDVQVLADGHGVTICVKSNQPGEEGGLEIQPYALEQETLRRPAMAAMPSLGLTQSLRQEHRLEQKLQQSIQLSLQDPYSGMCAIYAQAQKKTYNKHGMQFEYACVKRSEVPLIVAMGSAGMRWGDMIFVVEDYFPDSGTRPGFREQFNELVAVHEFGERLWSNHHQASMLEFAIAQKEGILEEYLDFLKGRYLLKFRDVVYERMLPELCEKLGLKEDEHLPADVSDVDEDNTHRIAAEHWRDGFNWPENLYKTYATELNEYDFSDEEVNKSETWAEAVRTQAFVEQYMEDAGKEFAKSFEKAFKKSDDIAASINTAAAVFYRKLDGLLTDIDEHEDAFNKDFLNDEVLASVVTRAHENLEASMLLIIREAHPLTRDQEIHRRAVTTSPFIKQTWSEHAVVLNAQRGYLSYLRDEREIDEIAGNEASAALKKLWADAVIPGLASGKYATISNAIADQYEPELQKKYMAQDFQGMEATALQEYQHKFDTTQDHDLASAWLERYIFYRISVLAEVGILRKISAAQVQPFVDDMLKRFPVKINAIDVSKMTADGKNLWRYNEEEKNNKEAWWKTTLIQQCTTMAKDDAKRGPILDTLYNEYDIIAKIMSDVGDDILPRELGKELIVKYELETEDSGTVYTPLISYFKNIYHLSDADIKDWLRYRLLKSPRLVEYFSEDLFCEALVTSSPRRVSDRRLSADELQLWLDLPGLVKLLQTSTPALLTEAIAARWQETHSFSVEFLENLSGALLPSDSTKIIFSTDTTKDRAIELAIKFLKDWSRFDMHLAGRGIQTAHRPDLTPFLNMRLAEIIQNHPELVALCHSRFAKLFDAKFYEQLANKSGQPIATIIHVACRLLELHISEFRLKRDLTALGRIMAAEDKSQPDIANAQQLVLGSTGWRDLIMLDLIESAEIVGLFAECDEPWFRQMTKNFEQAIKKFRTGIDVHGSLATVQKKQYLAEVKAGNLTNWKKLRQHYSKIFKEKKDDGKVIGDAAIEILPLLTVEELFDDDSVLLSFISKLPYVARQIYGRATQSSFVEDAKITINRLIDMYNRGRNNHHRLTVHILMLIPVYYELHLFGSWAVIKYNVCRVYLKRDFPTFQNEFFDYVWLWE